MATLIGDKSNQYDTQIVDDSGFYPTLKLSDFQQLFGFLEDTTEFEITQTMTIQSVKIHGELTSLRDQFSTLVACSQERFNNDTAAGQLYTQAVFSLTAAVLIDNRLATDATKEAADRQEALANRNQSLRTQYREAIELLLDQPGMTVDLI